MNGIPARVLRDTCASHTVVHDRLVLANQYVPGKTKRVRAPSGEATVALAIVPLEIDGSFISRKVVVNKHPPLDCLLGSDHSEVGRSHSEVLVQCQTSCKDWGGGAERTASA